MKNPVGRPKKSNKLGLGYKNRRKDGSVIFSNQWQASPKQEKFLALYLDPTSSTFANAYTSALEAGYEETYAKVIASPSFNSQWIQEARDIISMKPEHITQALQKEAMDKNNRPGDRIRALELIGKMQGVFIDKQVVAHVNIEDAIRELK